MPVDVNEVQETVFEAIRQNNEVLADDRQVPVALETPLIGKSAVLDSLGVVNLIVAVEQALGDKYEREIIIASDRAMSRKNSPFRTIGTLVEYAIELLNEQPA